MSVTGEWLALKEGTLPICMKRQQNRLCLCDNQMQTDSSWCGRCTSRAAAGRALMETPLTEEPPHRALRLYWRTLRGAGLLQLFAWSAEGVTNHTFNARRDHSRSRRAADSWITDHVGAQIPVRKLEADKKS